MALEKAKSIDSRLEKIDDEALQLSTYEKFKMIFSNITVEPIMVCYILPNVMASLAMQNVNLEKACRVDLAYNSSVCDALIQHNTSGYTESEEIAVQKLVATASAIKCIIQSLLPTIILLFLGSWSDRHDRRKPAIIMPIIGEIVTTTCFMICTYYFYELSLIYNVLSESVPPGITGGWFSMFMGVFSYISAKCGAKSRTLRIGAVNMFSNVSLTIGIALSGVLYKHIGTYGVLGITLSMYLIGLTYGIFRVQEEPIKQNKENQKSFIKDFFDHKHVLETIKVALKKGERNRKTRICTIMILVMVIIGPMHGEMVVMYLFVRYKFKWDEIDYSIYSTFNFVAHMTGTLFSLIFFSKYLKVDDALLGMISSLSKIASCFVYAFAPTPTIFYLGAIVEMLNGTSFIAMRSIISKLVPANELGKIYSLFGVSEALMPLIYGPMYSFVYKKTIDVLPGAFFIVGGCLTLPAVLIFLWLYQEHKRDERELKSNKKQTDKLLRNEKSLDSQEAD